MSNELGSESPGHRESASGRWKVEGKKWKAYGAGWLLTIRCKLQANQHIRLNQLIQPPPKQKALLMQDFLLHIVRDKYVLAKQLLIQIQWIGVGFTVIRIDTSYPDAAGHSL